MAVDDARFADLVDWAIARQGRASLLFLLALCLGTATALLIAFFQINGWQGALLAWAWDHEHAGVILAVAEGSWHLTWKQWAAVGAGATGLLLGGWFMLQRSVAQRMREVRGLRAAVHAERERRTKEAFVLAGCLMALLLLPFAIAWGASHHDDWDDD